MTQESAVSVTEAPEGDAFYTPPSPLPGVHGDVIWSRSLDGVAALGSAAHNELVLYRSDAVDGTPIAVSGIVALPQVPAPDGVPIRISHAQRDNRVKIDYSNRLVAELGGLYNDVTYHIHPEVHMYPELGDEAPLLGAHFGVLQTDSPELTVWLRQRLGA